MRLFVAVEIPPGVQERLAAVRVASRDSAWRWVAAGNVHLTLKFLGETDEGLVPRIKEALDLVCRPLTPFELGLAGLGTLPPSRPPAEGDRRPPRPPRVLYAGLDRGTVELRKLVLGVEEAMAALGYQKEQRLFTPHATLSRVRKEQRPRDAAELLGRFAGKSFGAWRCGGAVLFLSDLGPGGARYTELGEFPFGA
ncbi:MAG: 2'-5' RNA ligase [Candidatus Coatesbacteria bacterium RBG_13_66_14]|uniref:RNA 2',3'-cyclic phosphodiesterase n=1 Tax=Candidatus Coatesbacteria bacterium RBG_13_66_14 TaxID=1817816 RepID=A0A1F5FGQ8_9BACT|nr:MAG: 2'-5' RNA ligase [Candidatus Coatesbacteria bacterium RBG_13_66_14]